jgi:DNA helicase-2/ATP-dependent DNA helicase PcrA
MVDEYQDANVAQFHLLKELCGPETYVCVVGDDDQSIYRFRGAEVKNILEFPDRFSGADIIRLERNYRSTDPILKAASSVVDNNSGRLGKILRAEKGNGPLPVHAGLPDQDEEAAFCAEKIESSVKKGETSWSDWAILYRTNAQSLGFETLFLRRGIPYRVVGSLKFYEREEIKDALALLSFMVNPKDEVNFRRVVNKPARGVGAVTVDKIIGACDQYDGNLIEAGGSIELAAKARAGLDKFFKVIDDAKIFLTNSKKEEKKPGKKRTAQKRKEGLISGEGLSVCVTQLVVDSGLAEFHAMQDEITGNSKLGNLQELVNAASEYPQSFEGLIEFLEDIELDRSIESADNNSQNSVTLITFHNTKGLEFKRVIMTGLEQGIFPREDKKGEELEEERRLFYVGATRAMEELYLTSCSIRRRYGKIEQMQPSLFLSEIDSSCLQTYNTAKHGVFAMQSMASRSYNQYNFKNDNVKKSEVEERAGWRTGERVFHEDYGYGAVMEVKDSEDGPIVRVRFDHGKETRFLSEYQGRAFEKVREDY